MQSFYKAIAFSTISALNNSNNRIGKCFNGIHEIIQKLKDPQYIFLLSKRVAINVPFHLGFIPIQFCFASGNVIIKQKLRWKVTITILASIRILAFLFGISNSVNFPTFHQTNVFRAFKISAIIYTAILQLYHLYQPFSFECAFNILLTLTPKFKDLVPSFRLSINAGLVVLVYCIFLLIGALGYPIAAFASCTTHFLDDILDICGRGGALNASYYKIIFETIVHMVLICEMVSSTFVYLTLVVEAIAFVLAYFNESTKYDVNEDKILDHVRNKKWFSLYKMLQLSFHIINFYYSNSILPAAFSFLMVTSVISMSLLILYAKIMGILMNLIIVLYSMCVILALICIIDLLSKIPANSNSAIQARVSILARHHTIDKYHKCLIKSLKPVKLRLGSFYDVDVSLLPTILDAILNNTVNVILAAK